MKRVKLSKIRKNMRLIADLLTNIDSNCKNTIRLNCLFCFLNKKKIANLIYKNYTGEEKVIFYYLKFKQYPNTSESY